MNTFDVALASDQAYVRNLAAVISSLTANNRDVFLNIHVINQDISKSQWSKLLRSGHGSCYKLIDCKVTAGDLSTLPVTNHFSSANYYRLLMPEVLSGDVALYLDSDVIVSGSIGELFQTDLRDAYLAAVENPGFTRHAALKMNESSRYFNSGVMLCNLSRWRSSELKRRVVDMVRENRHVIEYADQDGLNAIVNGHWIPLGLQYNYQTSMLPGHGCESPVEEANSKPHDCLSPIIIHFSGRSKPWHLNNSHPFKEDYWRYRNSTPYRSWFSDDLSPVTIAFWLLPRFAQELVRKIRR
jgi:lipopolysaccharide biosynthesis glycosyltransferase